MGRIRIDSIRTPSTGFAYRSVSSAKQYYDALDSIKTVPANVLKIWAAFGPRAKVSQSLHIVFLSDKKLTFSRMANGNNHTRNEIESLMFYL